MAFLTGARLSRPDHSARRRAYRRRMERMWRSGTGASSLLPLILLLAMAAGLLLRSWPILSTTSPWALLTGTVWQPLRGSFGFLPFIAGTAWVTFLAMLLAVPPSLLISLYLVEYAGTRLRSLMKPVLDVLAGIPSVVYGVWGLIAVVPVVQAFVSSPARDWLSGVPFLQSENPTGFSVLSGSLVLSVMVMPGIVAISYEVLQAVPQGLREATLALGATRWQAVKHVVLRKAAAGIAAAVVLGFSRAFGETMAVLMVVGNVPRVPSSIFDPAYPLPALIANNYGEMMSIPLYDAALMCAALVLLILVFVFNLVSTVVLQRVSHRMAE